jgi:hypothetical protein
MRFIYSHQKVPRPPKQSRSFPEFFHSESFLRFKAAFSATGEISLTFIAAFVPPAFIAGSTGAEKEDVSSLRKFRSPAITRSAYCRHRRN